MQGHDEAKALLKKIHDWLTRLAKQSDEQSASCSGRFDSLAEANRADARNFRAVCKEIASVLKKMDGKP